MKACLTLLATLGMASATTTTPEATDFPGTWTTTGSWSAQESGALDGVDVLTCNPGRNVATDASVTVEGPGILRFSYRCLRENPSYSLDTTSFSLVMNGTPTWRASGGATFPSSLGDTGWQEVALPLPAGSNTVQWSASNLYVGAPLRVYLDQVWLESDARPRYVPPALKTATFGEAFEWEAPIISDSPATVTAASLPPGLSVSSSGAVSGTPTHTGTFTATFTVTNAAGSHTAEQLFLVQPGAADLTAGLDTTVTVTESHTGVPMWRGGTVSASMGAVGEDVAWAEFAEFTADSATLTITVKGPGTLRFLQREESPSPSNVDLIRTVVRNGTQPVHTGTPPFAGWEEVALTIPAGPQVLTLTTERTALVGQYWGILPMPRTILLDNLRFEPTTIPPQSSFTAWVAAWNIPSLPEPPVGPGGVDFAADVDGDGLTVLMEYATGGDPYTADPGKLPVISIVDDHLTIDMPKASTPTDLLYFVQGSKTLAPNSWTTSTVEVLDEDETHILARYKKTITEEPVAHLRVRVLIAQ